MCTQCMIGAMSAGAGATGMRAWIAAHAPVWMTPARMHAVTVSLLATALALSATVLSGGG